MSRLIEADLAAVRLRLIKKAVADVDADFQVYLRMTRGAATVEQRVAVAASLVEHLRSLEAFTRGTLLTFGCAEDPFPLVVTIPEEHINES